MTIDFVTQGLDIESNRPIGPILIENLNKTCYSSFKATVAFMSRAGITGLSNHIETARQNDIDINFLVGVDNEGTSKEALEELLALNVSSSIFHTTQGVIFHPKLYFFEGEQNLLIIGSSNLTVPGLFQNVESSIIVEYESTDKEGQKFIAMINKYFDVLLSGNDANTQILNQDLIDDLVEAGIVPIEEVRLRKQNKSKKKIHSNRNNEALNKIKSKFPSFKIQIPGDDFRKRATEPIQHEEEFEDVADMVAEANPTRGELVWQKNNIPPSDTQVVDEGTNPTGRIKLTQAGFRVDNSLIDHLTYFRNDIWGNYTWVGDPYNPQAEISTIPVRIILRNRDYGTYDLVVRHNPGGEAGQANYTTSISWGEIGNNIGRLRLNDLTLRLYRSTLDGNEIFELTIS